MPTCLFPARAAALRLTVLLVGLLTCQAIRTPSTLNAPTHYARNSPCVLETPQYNICHGSNRVHARFLPTWPQTPSKILPKSSCFASRVTFPWNAFADSDILRMLNALLPFQPLELDFQTLNFDNLARVHDTLLHPQLLDDNLNFSRSPPLTNLLLFAFLPQNMPGNRTIAPEINISNSWHIIPTSGDLLANDTNDLAHFLSLHPIGSWPPKAPPKLNLQVTSSTCTFTFERVKSKQSKLYSTHFFLIHTSHGLSMSLSASFFVSSPATVLLCRAHFFRIWLFALTLLSLGVCVGYCAHVIECEVPGQEPGDCDFP